MVAAGSCVAAPLEGSLLCNAAAAAGPFASLENVKSQAYQHIETSAARRLGGDAEFLQNRDAHVEEKSSFDASDAVAFSAAVADGAVPSSAAAAPHTSAAAPAEAPSAGNNVVVPHALCATAAYASSGRAASSAKIGSVDPDVSDCRAKSSSSCVSEEEAASPGGMLQQQVSFTTAAGKRTSTTLIPREEAASGGAHVSSLSQPSSNSTAVSFPSVGRPRRWSVCTCDGSASPMSSSSSRRENSDKDSGNSADGGEREVAEREDSNIRLIQVPETAVLECDATSSSSCRANSAAAAEVDRRAGLLHSEDSSITKKEKSSSNLRGISRKLSMTSAVVAASEKQEGNSSACGQRGVSSCDADGALHFSKGSDDVAAASVAGTSSTVAAAAAAGAADAETLHCQQSHIEATESWRLLRENAESFGEIADTSAAAEGAAGSSDAAATVRNDAAAVAALEIEWGKDKRGERHFFGSKQQRKRHVKMQQQLGEQQEPAKSDLFFLLASDLAVGKRGPASQQQQQEQNDDECPTTTRKKQQETSLFQEEKQEHKYLLQCDRQLEYLLQPQEGTPQNQQQQQEMDSDLGCGGLLRSHEGFNAQETAAPGETISVQQEQSSPHLNLMWEQVFDDPYLDRSAAARALSSSNDVNAVEEPATHREERLLKEDEHHHHQQQQQPMEGFSNCSRGEKKKQQQQDHSIAECISSTADDSSYRSVNSSTASRATPQPEVTPRRGGAELKEPEVALLHAFPESTTKDSSYAALRWDVSMWQGVPLLEQQLGQQESRKQQHEEEERQEGEAEDVVMTSLASQGSVAQVVSYCAKGSAAVVDAQQQEEHFSFDLWQKHHIANGRKNGVSSPCSSNSGKAETLPSTPTLVAMPAAMVAMQPQCLLMSESSGREQHSAAASAAAAMNAAAAGETAASELSYVHAEAGDSKKEENVMEEGMFLCNACSNSEAAGALGGGECGTGATAASSVAETATVNAAAEARLCDSSGEEDDEDEHHSILDTCLPSVEDARELPSPPPPFSLWTERQRLASSCAVAAAAVPTAGGVHLGSEAAAAVAPEEVATATATDATEEAADSVMSTSCSFFFSNLTEAACEEKSTRGCCAVVAGVASESVGLCSSSSSDEDEDESGPEDETSTGIFEHGGGSDWSSRPVFEETAGGSGGAAGEAEDGGALLPAYSAKRMLKKNVFCSSDPFQHEETVFIFDWDDTLLPSSWLSQKGLTLDSSNIEIDLWRKKLSAAAAHAEQTLYAARALGRVVIVTNAETGWIDLSCSKFMPDLAPLLRCFRIVSARSVYESSCCNTPFLWKVAAFTEELRRHFPVDTKRRWNVISVGDSTHEREALFSVCGRLGQFYNVTTKSLKLLEAPAVEDLHSQHELMLECLETVAKHKGNLDLCVASVLEAAVEKGDYAGTPLPAGLERCTVGLHCLRYHPLAPEVVGRA